MRDLVVVVVVVVVVDYAAVPAEKKERKEGRKVRLVFEWLGGFPTSPSTSRPSKQ